MTKYDESLEIPAPIAEIIVRNMTTGERVRQVRMLLDTGSDISLLPNSVVKSLEIESLTNESFSLIGFDGNQIFAEVFYLQIVFLGKRFTGKYCVVDDRIRILGRDVLNQVSILFDGLNLNWQEIIEQTREI